MKRFAAGIARALEVIAALFFFWYALGSIYHVGAYHGSGWGTAAWFFTPIAAFVAPFFVGAGIHITATIVAFLTFRGIRFLLVGDQA